MNIRSFDEIWKKRDSDATAQAVFWDRRADSFNERKKDDSSRDMRRLLARQMIAKCRLTPESRVLDVGCGTGNYALSLAKRAGWVTGFDISPKMIAHARENAAAAGAKNIDFRVLDWETADLAALDWEKRFDLVLASRTPAISDKAGLDKMIAACKGACLLVTMAESRNSVREKLMPLVGWDEEKARARRPFYCAFNLLWLMGYNPEVTYVDHAWEADYALEDSLLMHRGSFENLRPLTAEEKQAVADCLAREAVNGMVRERVTSKLAVVFWRV